MTLTSLSVSPPNWHILYCILILPKPLTKQNLQNEWNRIRFIICPLSFSNSRQLNWKHYYLSSLFPANVQVQTFFSSVLRTLLPPSCINCARLCQWTAFCGPSKTASNVFSCCQFSDEVFKTIHSQSEMLPFACESPYIVSKSAYKLKTSLLTVTKIGEQNFHEPFSLWASVIPY